MRTQHFQPLSSSLLTTLFTKHCAGWPTDDSLIESLDPSSFSTCLSVSSTTTMMPFAQSVTCFQHEVKSDLILGCTCVTRLFSHEESPMPLTVDRLQNQHSDPAIFLMQKARQITARLPAHSSPNYLLWSARWFSKLGTWRCEARMA